MPKKLKPVAVAVLSIRQAKQVLVRARKNADGRGMAGGMTGSIGALLTAMGVWKGLTEPAAAWSHYHFMVGVCDKFLAQLRAAGSKPVDREAVAELFASYVRQRAGLLGVREGSDIRLQDAVDALDRAFEVCGMSMAVLAEEEKVAAGPCDGMDAPLLVRRS